ELQWLLISDQRPGTVPFPRVSNLLRECLDDGWPLILLFSRIAPPPPPESPQNHSASITGTARIVARDQPTIDSLVHSPPCLAGRCLAPRHSGGSGILRADLRANCEPHGRPYATV